MQKPVLFFLVLAALVPRGEAFASMSLDLVASEAEPDRPAQKGIASASSSSVSDSSSTKLSDDSFKRKLGNTVKKASGHVVWTQTGDAAQNIDRLTVFVSTDASGPSLPGDMMWVTRPGLIKKRNMLYRTEEESGTQRYCADTNWGPTNAKQRCVNVPNNTLVKVSHFGYCEAMQIEKNCTYFVMVQEPVANTVQSYNSYCLSCGHKGLFCERTGHTCPNISIIDWARSRSNILTRSFGTKVVWGAEEADGQTPTSTPAEVGGRDLKARKGTGLVSRFVETLEEDDFRRALRHLRRPNVRPIGVEELNIGQRGRSNGITVLGDLLGTMPISELAQNRTHPHLVARLNTSMQKLVDKASLSYLPTAAELDEIRRIMKYDILIFKALFGRSDEAR